ncbi:hypothetical protein CAPTEDRAFT_198341 [Capitella teleta]|uniref:HAT C-terminal dimerisation domain-containing protein n=1 Tax=Capitella teleta TaxID=283909 RepID=R7UAJ5_CAPTE|nr:hypothetical protein CAPTEDRAFT_198341 [Capitella teleta]|eukprot:ELU03151.1 hypothetical protein CAPTEDRAFT_198341 [Capitella teleta]
MAYASFVTKIYSLHGTIKCMIELFTFIAFYGSLVSLKLLLSQISYLWLSKSQPYRHCSPLCITTLALGSQISPPEEVVEPSPKKICLAEEEEWLDEITAVPSTSPTSTCIEYEIQDFFREPQIAAKSDPLFWWKEKETLYAKVAPVARHLLAIPASAVPADRIFSLAGDRNVFMNEYLAREKYKAAHSGRTIGTYKARCVDPL